MIWIFQPNIKDDNEIALEDVASLKTYLIFINIYCLNLIFRECYEPLENKDMVEKIVILSLYHLRNFEQLPNQMVAND